MFGRGGRKKDDAEQLDRIERKINHLIALLYRVVGYEGEQVSKLDEIITAVENQSTVVTSVETAIAGLVQEVRDALATGDVAKAEAALAAIEGNTTRLSAAVVAGTSSPEAPPA